LPPSAIANEIDALIGESAGMVRLKAEIRHLAALPVDVLLTGETGTGKELVARALHGLSQGRSREFVAINTSCLGEHTSDSELFGTRRGAYTGAVESKGLAVVANGGTLFLDEIGNLAPGLQGKLLRFLQDKHVRSVGSNRYVITTARVVAATNAPENLREDLRHRFPILLTLPPLRERRDDIPLLLEHLLVKSAARLKIPARLPSARDVEMLLGHAWSGNIRELENVVLRFIITGQPIAALLAT
jgi:transcriptional regulator with PAS, ATPase and Fis domain